VSHSRFLVVCSCLELQQPLLTQRRSEVRLAEMAPGSPPPAAGLQSGVGRTGHGNNFTTGTSIDTNNTSSTSGGHKVDSRLDSKVDNKADNKADSKMDSLIALDSRSSSQNANNAAGTSVSLNLSTQSFETMYQPPDGSLDGLGGTGGIAIAGGHSVGISPTKNSNGGQHALAESRIVCVSGIDPSTPDTAILQQFECFGDVHSISSKDSKHSGYVVIVYHDIRAARLAMHSSGKQWRGRQLSCTMLDERAFRSVYNTPMTTLYLVALDYGNGEVMDDIFYLLSAYGELKELKRDVHSRPHCCLAEFYDSRHAAVAFSNLQSVEGLRHKLLVLDARDVGASKGGAGAGVQEPLQSLPFSSSHQSIPQISGVPPMVHSSSTPSTMSHSYPQHSHVHQPTQSIDDVLTKNLSDMSLESMHGGFYTGHHQSYPTLQQHSLDQIWREPGGGGGNGAGLSHSSSPPSNASLFSPHLSSSQNVLAALQAQQRVAIQTQQIQAQTQQIHAQNSAAIHLALSGQHGQQEAATSGGVSGLHGGKTLPYSRIIGGAPSVGAVTRRNHSDPGLGGRLARNKMNPVAEAERKAHQDRMYGLNLNKIASGEDKRTTLMIKNIPNKYTQKMLLALLEERFAGMYPFPFDFFYLPIDFKNKCNVGYAFINMTTPLAIPALVEDFHGKRWPKFNSEKVCQIAYGRIQGKLSLIQHFQNSSLLHEDKRCRPVLFNSSGEVELFPIGPAALANFSLKQHAMELSSQARGAGPATSPSFKDRFAGDRR
jgi:hypothetical protein